MQNTVFWSLAPGKAVCAGTTIFSVFQHIMYLKRIFAKFGDSMVKLKWVFRGLKIAIFANRGLYPVLPGGKLLEHFFFPAALASAVINVLGLLKSPAPVYLLVKSKSL